GVETEEPDEDLAVVAFARVDVEPADGGDDERARALVDLRRVHGERRDVRGEEHVRVVLRLARGGAGGEGEGPRQMALGAEAAACEQAAHAAEGEAEGDGDAGVVGGLPEGELVALEERDGDGGGAD